MNWLQSAERGVVLSLRVVPRASRNAIGGRHGDTLKIRLQAPPVEGKANAALAKVLGKALGVPPSHIRVISGATARTKRVLVEGLTETALREKHPEWF